MQLVVPHQARRLLVLSCSDTKLKQTQALAAIQRYDGPAFRVLRKWQHDPQETVRVATTDVLILSTEFGLIGSNQLIPFYDRRMTPVRARELARQVQPALHAHIQNHAYSEVFFNLGETYLLALGAGAMPLPVATVFARSTIGKRLQQMKAWLYTTAPRG